jgi:hypothetical protein
MEEDRMQLKRFAITMLCCIAMSPNATGQTLIGLPKYGVTLGGTPEDPSILKYHR